MNPRAVYTATVLRRQKEPAGPGKEGTADHERDQQRSVPCLRGCHCDPFPAVGRASSRPGSLTNPPLAVPTPIRRQLPVALQPDLTSYPFATLTIDEN